MSEKCCCEPCYGCNTFHEYYVDGGGGGWGEATQLPSFHRFCEPCSHAFNLVVVEWVGAYQGSCTWSLVRSELCTMLDMFAIPPHEFQTWVDTISTLTLTYYSDTHQWRWFYGVAIKSRESTSSLAWASYRSEFLDHCKDTFDENGQVFLTKYDEITNNQYSFCMGQAPDSVTVYGKQ
jgi:hypothetical protein